MAEAQITRQEVLTVVSRELNEYGDLLFTDHNGTGHKVSEKRVKFFDIIQPNTVVQLNYAVAYNKEYIYNAVSAEGQLPAPKPPGEAPNRMAEQAKAVGAVEKGNTKDRGVALSYAKDVLVAGMIGKEDIEKWADRFLKYILN